jgi:two-component system sensor histidine kinase HydH
MADSFNAMAVKLKAARELEAELRRKEKLLALGEFAARMAHEIRNPLGIMKSSAGMLRKGLGEGTEEAEIAGYIISEVDRLNRIVTDLLHFAKPREPLFASVDICRLCDAILDSATMNAGGTALKVVRDYPPVPPMVRADPDLVRQVLLNLVLNAAQAMSGGGTLTVRVVVAPPMAEVIVMDTGPGIAPENAGRIFEPFFSTRPEGVGLGLSICYSTVKAHSGELLYQGAPGGGARFHFTLPLWKEI